MSKQSFQELAEEVTEDEFKDFVGDNAYKFAEARKRALAGKKECWSWLILFFAPIWSAYYKMWTPVLVIFSASILTGILAQSPGAGSVVGQIIAVIYALRLKTGYVRYAYQKISALKEVESDPDRLKAILKKKGGTSKLSAAAVIVFILLLLLVRVAAETEI